MARIDIYTSEWIDLVFEGRNKSYGAYQLRRENFQTTLKALLLGIGILCILILFSFASNYFNKESAAIMNEAPSQTIKVTELYKYKEAPAVEKPIVPEKTKTPEQKSTVAADSRKKEKFVPLEVVPGNNSIDTPTITELTNAAPAAFTDDGDNHGNITIGVNGLSSGNTTGTEGLTSLTEGTGIYNPTELDSNPAFPGGLGSFYSLVSKNFRNPESEHAMTSRIYVYFVVEKDGSMTDFRVINNPGKNLEREALRVLSAIKTKWKPGIKNGESVRTAYNLPITINVR